MPRLIVASSGSERTVDLSPGKPVSVGREAANDIALPDERQASRRHCEIRPTPGGWEVVDLGATNKTRVNGSAIEKRALASGDVIEVGKVTLKYEDPEEEARLQQAGRQGVCLLEWADGPKKGQRVLLAQPRTTLGRRDSNSVVLDDRMASGHHAEIVKDLNGYTIRDLGSTNGILVNGNPTTEAPLVHGTRLRVGNSRFVFKDPSMKDVEVELSRLEEDDGWGMMGDIDLSKARGGKAGTLALLAVLALVGAGGWWVWNEGQRSGPKGAGAGGASDRILNGSFESADLPWVWPEGGALSVVRVPVGSGHALQARHDASQSSVPETVSYEDDFAAADGRTLHVKARLRGQGELQALWHNEADEARGITGLTRVVVLGTGESGAIDLPLGFPSWATGMHLALRVPPGGSATLDDVSLKARPETPPIEVCECPGLPKGHVEPDGTLSISSNLTVLVVGGAAVAWQGDKRLTFRPAGAAKRSDLTVSLEGSFTGGEKELPGRVAFTATEDGLSVQVECAGADRLGLAVEMPRAHLGPTANVVTAGDARTVPLALGTAAKDVRKTLVGSPEPTERRPATILAFEPAAGTAELVVEDSGEPTTLRLLHVVAGAKAAFGVTTDFSRQMKAAQDALHAAVALVRTSPGAGIRALDQLRQEYPFEAKVAEEASKQSQALRARADKDVAEAKSALAAFRILGSPAARADLETRSKALRTGYLSASAPIAEGTLEADVAALTRDADALLEASLLEQRLPDVDRLEKAADVLQETDGYKAMAAWVYRSLAQDLTPLAKPGSDVAQRAERLASRAQALEQEPDVKNALPPLR